jgi:hypothetical protein
MDGRRRSAADDGKSRHGIAAAKYAAGAAPAMIAGEIVVADAAGLGVGFDRGTRERFRALKSSCIACVKKG